MEDDAGGIDGLAHARLDGLLQQHVGAAQHRIGGDVLCAASACGVIKNLLSKPGEGAAEALGHQGQGLLPEPAGDGIVLQQFGDGGKIPEQLLFWVRHNIAWRSACFL